MKKNSNKKKTKENNFSPPLQSVNINLSENMSREEIQHMIACAIIEAEEIKAQKEEEEHKIAVEKWQSKIGYKEYNNKRQQFFNDIKVFRNILFLPKKDIEGVRISIMLLKSVLSIFFGLMKWCSLIVGIFVIVYLPIQCVTGNIKQLSCLTVIFCILFFILAFIFSRLFRIADIEIENLEDRNYLFCLFTSITSFVSIIVAIIAIVKGA